jgi:hypothetical protein
MWRWTLNWSEIRDDIVVGSCPVRPADVDRIRDDAGAGALLSLQTDDCRAGLGIDGAALAAHAARRGLVAVNVPLPDFDPEAQRRGLPEAVRSLAALLAAGHRTYVHCTAGVNRGPLVVLGYLTFVEGMDDDGALALIHRARPAAEPYRDAFEGCRADVLAAADAGGGGEQEILRRAFSGWEAGPDPR